MEDRYLWRELLIYRSLQGYAVFSTRDDVKTIDNLPDPAPGWESRFFSLVRFVMLENGEEHAPKRVHLLEEGSIFLGFDSSTEDASEHSPVRGSSTTADREDRRRATLTQEFIAQPVSKGTMLLSDVTLLREEFEASRAEVARLQLLFSAEGAQPSTIIEYLQSVAYRHQVDFERAYHSQDAYLSVAILDTQEIIFRYSLYVELAERLHT
ncbi:hypothetical protein ACLOJK_014984 [Asimina triloba]